MIQKFRLYDPWLFALALLVTAIGLLFIFDAGYARSLTEGHGWFPPEFKSQLGWLAPALIVCFACTSLSAETWLKLSKVLWVFTLVLLVAVKRFGHHMNGAQRWIGYGPVHIEPSEFAKLAVVLYLAGLFANRKKWPSKIPPRKDLFHRIETVWLPKAARCLPGIYVLIAVVLIAGQPDLGTAAVVAVTGFAMFVPGGVSRQSLIAVVVLSLVGGWILIVKEPYRLERITHHIERWNPENRDDLGYQTAQAELAQADGGVLGVGIGAGRAKHLIPATTTDFIQATIGEETGLWGSLFVLASLGALVARLLFLARQATSRFSMLVLFGTAAWIGIQASVNVMMANAFLPAIGIPMPFVSSGGSSLLALWMAIGVCQSCLAPSKAKSKNTEEEGKLEDRDHGRWDGRTRLSGA